MSVTVSEGIAAWSPEQRKKEIPYAVAWIIAGAVVHRPYKGREDVIGLELDGEFMAISEADWKDVHEAMVEVEKAGLSKVPSAEQVLKAHRMACAMVQDRPYDKSVVMLKDRSGAGYWRMVLPANHLQSTTDLNLRVDVTASEVKFESLLEYDTVFVQRVHDWESYYVLKKLWEAGKHLVYDIDDDFFSLTPDNPAFHVIGKDNQMAAVECMKLADIVTTTTDELAGRLRQVCDGEIEPVVIPNAMVAEGWNPTELTGSPDGIKRIFWQGSATHEEDWQVCIEAVDAIMKSRTDVHLVILGYLPKVIQSLVGQPHWQGKVEYMGFSDAETYFQIVKHLRAEVGLAPLRSTQFNQAKSPIKWLENALIGMPTVASACKPYTEVIDDGMSGRLVPDDPEMWMHAIEGYLDDKRCRLDAIAASRKLIAEDFDIKKVAEAWRMVLIP